MPACPGVISTVYLGNAQDLKRLHAPPTVLCNGTRQRLGGKIYTIQMSALEAGMPGGVVVLGIGFVP